MSEAYQLQTLMSDFEVFNEEFYKVKIRIAYTDKNRNMTCISREAFEKALPSLPYIPIVGEYIKSEEQFGGHGGKITIDDEGFKFEDTTRPYGVVTNEKPFWEEVRELNGQMKEYLCCYGYLWAGRYEELKSLKDKDFQQSMEINVLSGDYGEDNYFNIKEFRFSALCILQKYEPCFESSVITADFSKKDFKSEYQEMIFALERYIDNKKEVSAIVENLEPIQEEKETFEEKKVETEIVETTEEFEAVEKETKEEVEVEPVNYELEISNLNETINKLTSDFESLKQENENLKAQNSVLESENQSLTSFKLAKEKEEQDRQMAEYQVKIDEVCSQFAFEEEEIKDLKEKTINKELSLDELELNLFALEGKKLHSNKNFSKKETKDTTVIKIKENYTEESAYGNLSVYFNKK